MRRQKIRRTTKIDWASYNWEKIAWVEFATCPVTFKNARKILNDLVAHFKTPKVGLRAEVTRSLWGKTWAGRYYGKGVSIWGNPYPAKIKIVVREGDDEKKFGFGTLIHEFAHHLDRTRLRDPWLHASHGRTFKQALREVYKYAVKFLPPSYQSQSYKKQLLLQIVKKQIQSFMQYQAQKAGYWVLDDNTVWLPKYKKERAVAIQTQAGYYILDATS